MESEIKRIEELLSYQILDTKSEQELNELSEMASLIFDVPIALITFVDQDRQWFKVNIGLEITQTKREDSFCQHLLTGNIENLIIEDTFNDPRFCNNPLVNNNPNIRFYAGAPLSTPSGNILGSFCIIDNKPRQLSSEQIKVLHILAKKAMDFLNFRKLILDLREEIKTYVERLRKLTNSVPDGIFQLKMTSQGILSFEFISEGMIQLHPTVTMQEWLNSPEIGFTLIHPDDLEDFKAKLMDSFTNLTFLNIEYRVLYDKDFRWHSMKGNPEKMADGSVVWYGSFHNINNRVEYEIAIDQIVFDISHVLRRPVSTLMTLNNLIDNEKDISYETLVEYVTYFKKVSEEMETYTLNLNEIYHRKKELITNKR
ncbi:GAF domain-containing protein [Flavobacterium glaciei]|uniref:GAF domain-containing protein n=1 Tax=Flavobacterium glaciei TaxID=386300 RepID=A0A562PS42_9FLAO|nr:GAF domain-containing protein [Flavobacterium glaciei]RDI53659.1 GAF domain-containing protein [Flavobacterium glaciei]TWI46886.1 GAF domain-containing protein [Flavobacterium glaciei]